MTCDYFAQYARLWPRIVDAKSNLIEVSGRACIASQLVQIGRQL